jgi:hypothetical protein
MDECQKYLAVVQQQPYAMRRYVRDLSYGQPQVPDRARTLRRPWHVERERERAVPRERRNRTDSL